MREPYSELTRLIERLHRRLLDVLRAELNRMGTYDVNPAQALILVSLKNEQISIRSLLDRGYYRGSSASYNIKKLVDSGYLLQERSAHDRRSTQIRLSPQGLELCAKIGMLEDDLAARLAKDAEAVKELETACRALRRLERAWSDYIQYGYRQYDFEPVTVSLGQQAVEEG